ncbi:MAG TPA: MgtC/SapB family protein [Mucilaginibacter sp.]|jgi:putative Mg2+ transporter-C (MgtC) family protein|nr:MgtC/SapB family protein [Mucilaginibacter sp.]
MQFLSLNIAEQDVVKVGLAILCGGLLGLERQYKNKTAGFRTIILICLGSAIFTMIAQHAGAVANLNIVTGIGFIGAGVIFKDNIAVSGLTTAAVIWISAAIGMAIGSGNYGLSLFSTCLTLLVLILFSLLERYVDKIHRDKLFVILFTDANYEHLQKVEQIIKDNHLRLRPVKITKNGGCLQAAILVTGHVRDINRLDQQLMIMASVKSF